MGIERRGTAATPTRKMRSAQLVKARNKRIAMLVVSACIVLVVIALIATGLFLLLRKPADDGRILPNVTVGGIQIGGMTRQEATDALTLSIGDPISRKDMKVTMPGATLVLKPEDTQADLDVQALVNAAYSYGRTGSNAQQNLARAKAEKTSYVIPLLPYLDLDLDYIRNAVEEFCGSYSVALSQPTVSFTGERPVYVPPVEEEEEPEDPEDPENPENPDAPESPAEPQPPVAPEVPEEPEEPEEPIEHQVMTIVTGIPQFHLEGQPLYNEILDAYSLFVLEIAYEAPALVEPERLDMSKVFETYCTAAEDAFLDPDSFTVTPEIVGYGFNIADVQALVDQAGYGQIIEVTLDFLIPDITAKAYKDLFKDTLASCNSPMTGSNANRDNNLELACDAVNGFVLKAGEKFDFNTLLGPRTQDRGYLNAPTYAGSTTSTIGGGINQLASALHFCALQTGLQINERHAHRYAVPYTPFGTDASVTYGSDNLIFTNTTHDPIRILAEFDGRNLTVKLLGTDSRDYTTVILTEVLEATNPGIIYQPMLKDNVFGYTDGQILTPGIVGRKVQVFLCQYDKETGEEIGRQMLYLANYEKRDQVMVQIEGEQPEEKED